MSEHSRVTFTVECDALDGPAEVVQFQCSERLDEPFRALVELGVKATDIDAAAMLGADMVIVLSRAGSERRFAGLIKSVWEQPADTASEEDSRVRVELAPALSLLGLRRNTRMFQEQTVEEIVQTVLEEGLGDYGREVRIDLESGYPTREYCMQYQETDLAFVERLLAEEGIHYTFEHDGDVELLVLADTNDAFCDVPDGATLAFNPHDADVLDAAIHRFARRHAHTTTSVTIRESDWSLADRLVEAEKTDEDPMGRNRESYEHGLGRGALLTEYDPGEKAYQSRDELHQIALRHEAHIRDAIEAVGGSSAFGMRPGTRFALSGHPTVGLDGDYYVTWVHHRSAGLEGDAEATATNYACDFECRPIDAIHRPTYEGKKPSIASVQTAIVTGPSGEEIHTDEHGRIKVQFPWDRDNEADETSSCWVRCEQAWSGPGWGFWWLPRIGMEVVVRFLDGDPDRPMVTGCVYNGDNRPPYPLPDEKTKSTIKSNSSPGGGGSNELRFEDAAGDEEIYVHAQKDYNEIVLNDHTTTVHHDQDNTVDNDQTQTISCNQTEIVHGNQVMTVGGNRTVHVKGDFEETVDGTETRHTVGDVTEDFAANETRDVAADVNESIGGSETRTIGAGQTESVGANHTFTVGAASTRTVGGSYTLDVAGNAAENAPAGYTVLPVGGMDITIGGASTWTAPGGAKLIAPGGVTWVDEKDFWVGGADKLIQGTAQAFITFKIEAGGAAVGVSGLKCEQAAVAVFNGGINEKAPGVKNVMEATEFSTGALKSWLHGLFGSGG